MMSLWILLTVLLGLILFNPISNALPNWNPTQHRVHDDCHHCHARNQELERTIQILTANIYEHVLDPSLQQRLLSTETDLSKFSDKGRSPVVRSKREDLGTQSPTSTGCVPYPYYVDYTQIMYHLRG